jgi:hypothetical protein
MYHPVDFISLYMIAVIREFMPDIKDDKQAAGHTNGKAGNVNKTIPFMAEQIAVGDGKKMLEHKENK